MTSFFGLPSGQFLTARPASAQRPALRRRFSASVTVRLGRVVAGILDFLRRDPPNHDGRADHVGWALFCARPLGTFRLRPIFERQFAELFASRVVKYRANGTAALSEFVDFGQRIGRGWGVGVPGPHRVGTYDLVAPAPTYGARGRSTMLVNGN